MQMLLETVMIDGIRSGALSPDLFTAAIGQAMENFPEYRCVDAYGQASVTSLAERVSRFTVILKNPYRTTARVMGQLARVMRTLPFKARKSATFDRGSEFMDWPHLQADVGTQTAEREGGALARSIPQRSHANI
jgi:hypothetical protein